MDAEPMLLVDDGGRRIRLAQRKRGTDQDLHGQTLRIASLFPRVPSGSPRIPAASACGTVSSAGGREDQRLAAGLTAIAAITTRLATTFSWSNNIRWAEVGADVVDRLLVGEG